MDATNLARDTVEIYHARGPPSLRPLRAPPIKIAELLLAETGVYGPPTTCPTTWWSDRLAGVRTGAKCGRKGAEVRPDWTPHTELRPDKVMSSVAMADAGSRVSSATSRQASPVQRAPRLRLPLQSQRSPTTTIRGSPLHECPSDSDLHVSYKVGPRGRRDALLWPCQATIRYLDASRRTLLDLSATPVRRGGPDSGAS